MVANVIRYSKLRHLTWWLFGYAGVCISIIGVSLSRLGSSLQVVKAVYWFLCWYGYFSCYDERLVHHMCLRSTNERLLYLCQSLLSKHSLDFPFVDIQMRCPCSSSDRFLAVLLSTHIADLCCFFSACADIRTFGSRRAWVIGGRDFLGPHIDRCAELLSIPSVGVSDQVG